MVRGLTRFLRRVLVAVIGVITVWLIVFVIFKFADHRLHHEEQGGAEEERQGKQGEGGGDGANDEDGFDRHAASPLKEVRRIRGRDAGGLDRSQSATPFRNCAGDVRTWGGRGHLGFD